MKSEKQQQKNQPASKSEFDIEKDAKNSAYAFIVSDSDRFTRYSEFNKKNARYYCRSPFETDTETERRCKNEAYAFILQENAFAEFGAFLSEIEGIDPHMACLAFMIDTAQTKEKEVAV